jgi:hypothetical protein
VALLDMKSFSAINKTAVDMLPFKVNCVICRQQLLNIYVPPTPKVDARNMAILEEHVSTEIRQRIASGRQNSTTIRQAQLFSSDCD